MFNGPDPDRVAIQMQSYIDQNKSPKQLFYAFLSSRSVEGNFLSAKLVENKKLLRVITSPRGRQWIKANIDDFLNYLEYLSKV